MLRPTYVGDYDDSAVYRQRHRNGCAILSVATILVEDTVRLNLHETYIPWCLGSLADNALRKTRVVGATIWEFGKASDPNTGSE